MELKQVITLLESRLQEFTEDATIRDFDGGTFRAWAQDVEAILIRGLGDLGTRLLAQFRKAIWGLPMPDSIIDPGWQESMFRTRFESKLPEVEAILKSIIWELETFGFPDARVEARVGRDRPKVFIAHGGESGALQKLCDFLRALGVEPLVIEVEPSRGRLTEQQVDENLRQADCAIVFATYGHIVDARSGKKHPRLNVIDELGRCREALPDKTILLLEKAVELPSNVSGIVYERFAKQSMDKAFTKVAKELVAFGLIRATKG